MYLAFTPLCSGSFYPLKAHSPVYAGDHLSYVCRWFKFHVTLSTWLVPKTMGEAFTQGCHHLLLVMVIFHPTYIVGPI